MSGNTNFPSHAKDWKTFKTNNILIALNILFHKKERDKTNIHLKTPFRASKPGNSFNGHKWQKMALP